jgi:hypothetical protein
MNTSYMQIRPIPSLSNCCPLDTCPGFSQGSTSTPGYCDAYAPEEEEAHHGSSAPWISSGRPLEESPSAPHHPLDGMGTILSSESYFGFVVQSMGQGCVASSGEVPGVGSTGGGTPSSPDGCYVLKLSRSPDLISSHYSLTRVCSQAVMPLNLQLQMSWIT